MKINFTTKNDSNKLQRDAFLKLSHTERFYAWLNLMHRTNQLVGKKTSESDNFIIRINRD